MSEVGLPDEAARTLLGKKLLQMPFVRRNAQERIRAGELDLVLACPPSCDTCGAVFASPAMPQRIVWTREEETGESGISPWSGLTVFAGVVIYEEKINRTTLDGLYFICGKCTKAISSWVMRTYGGYPVNEGYRMTSIKAMT